MKFICWIVGHKWLIFGSDRGFGHTLDTYRCSRCNKSKIVEE